MFGSALRIAALLFSVVAAGAFNATVAAQEVALTVKRSVNGLTDTSAFTLEELLKLPQFTLVTENEFVDGPTKFRGPLARDLMTPLVEGRRIPSF